MTSSADGPSDGFAVRLREWLRSVAPGTTVGTAGDDARARIEDARRRGEAAHVLVCLTRDAIGAPLLTFTTGMLTAVAGPRHVTVVSLGLRPRDLYEPFARFETVSALDENAMRRLVFRLRDGEPAGAGTDALFDRAWRDFARDLRAFSDQLGKPVSPTWRQRRFARTWVQPIIDPDMEAAADARPPYAGLPRVIEHIVARFDWPLTGPVEVDERGEAVIHLAAGAPEPTDEQIRRLRGVNVLRIWLRWPDGRQLAA